MSARHPQVASFATAKSGPDRKTLAAESAAPPSGDPGAKAAGQGTTPPLDAPQVGGTLGRYVVLRTLGSGGMGVVYAAYDPELDRKVAIKLLHAGKSHGAGSIGRTRLLREAQALARLSHPSVVTIYDVGTVGDQVFIAMEYVEGGTLASWLAQQPRSRAEILTKFIDAGRGLEAAHRAGLVHRDFKPDGVLYRR